MVHVKQMICDGFKSFRTRTVVNFDKGFTAIVGANGSGKSNIIDAFVFVLGELSAKSLRATNIKDLISNGGNGLSASTTAKVEIIFDNSDNAFGLNMTEIRISRQIDRAGKGVYRLNGKKSTRKQILDYLDLSGLIPNSSNMIMQGELFRLINMNDTERRELIEQIAGISSYNERKLSAEDELLEVQANLGQITLLLNEVHEQLEQLRQEKEDAERFLSLQEEETLRENATHHIQKKNALDKITGIQEQCDYLTQKLEDMNTLEITIKKEIEAFELQIEDLKPQIEALQDQELLQMTYKLKSLKDRMTELKTSVKYAQKNLSTFQIEQKELQTRIESIENQKKILKEEILVFEDQKAKKTQEINTHTSKIQDINDKLVSIDAKFVSIKNQVTLHQKTIHEHQEIQHSHETQLKVIAQNVSNLNDNKSKLERRIFSNQSEIEKISLRLKDLKIQKRERLGLAAGDEASKKGIEVKISSLDKEVQQYQKRLQNLKPEAVEAQKALFELKSQIKVQNQMNFGSKAIKALRRARDKGEIKGIYGTISELGVTDERFATALEMAVGNRFNYFVIDNQITGEKCINYLKQNHLGRASFIPLDEISYSPFNTRVPTGNGIYGRAVDLIDFDQKYFHAFEYIFGRIIVVEDIPTARNLRISARRVTLEGDVVDGSNLMTGGQQKKSRGLGFESSVSDQKLINLEQKHNALQQEIQFLELKIKSHQSEISRLYKMKISGANRTKEIDEEIAIKKSKRDSLTEAIKVDEKEITEILMKIKELEEEKNSINEKLNSTLGKIQEIESLKHELDLKLENSEANEFKELLKKTERNLQKLQKEYNHIEIELTKKETTLTETLSSSMTEAQSQLKIKSEAITETTQSLTEFQSEIHQNQLESSELEQKINEKNQAVAQLMQQKKQLLLQISAQKVKLSQLNEDIYPIKLKINKFQMQKEDLTLKISEWASKIDPEVKIPENYLLLSIDEHKRHLTQLALEKASIGAVNLRAIEKFQDIEVRYEDLSVKNEQVIQERETILEFIAVLEKEKKRVFMNTFNAINHNFGYIFGKLSPGGEAGLVILNLEDPFSDGVEIIARPGEKEKCNVMALSGGERTLTIIALILGIQMHVPSPYYVLDEIDAALDDVNAALVADMIKELAEKSQFIIITHRDVTMARVDQLLGVSNIEGVTSVLNLSIRSVLSKLKADESTSDKVSNSA